MSRRVYVAGPIGANDEGRPARTRAAIDAAEKIRRAGMFPFVPHAMAFAVEHHEYEHHYECWMRYDDAWLQVSEAVFRVPGHSPGADREVARAEELDIPVFHDLDALVAWSRRAVLITEPCEQGADRGFVINPDQHGDRVVASPPPTPIAFGEYEDVACESPDPKTGEILLVRRPRPTP